MERSEILATMGELKLYGMKAAFDEIITTAVKRQHEPQRIVGDLLSAEIAEKQARSIKYQIEFKCATVMGHAWLISPTGIHLAMIKRNRLSFKIPLLMEAAAEGALSVVLLFCFAMTLVVLFL